MTWRALVPRAGPAAWQERGIDFSLAGRARVHQRLPWARTGRLWAFLGGVGVGSSGARVLSFSWHVSFIAMHVLPHCLPVAQFSPGESRAPIAGSDSLEPTVTVATTVACGGSTLPKVGNIVD